MFILLVEVEVRREHLDAFAAAIVENARASVARDPGCRRFEVAQGADDPTRWVFFEVYDDEQAWEVHRTSPHFLAYQAVATRALVSRTARTLRPIVMAPAS